MNEKQTPSTYDQIPADQLGNAAEQVTSDDDSEIAVKEETEKPVQVTDEQAIQEETSDEKPAIELDEEAIVEKETEEPVQETDEQVIPKETPASEQAEVEEKPKPFIPNFEFQEKDYTTEDFNKEAFDEDGEKTAQYEQALVKLTTVATLKESDRRHQQRQFQQDVLDLSTDKKEQSEWNKHGADFLNWLASGASDLKVTNYWNLFKQVKGLSIGTSNGQVDKSLQRMNKNIVRNKSLGTVTHTTFKAQHVQKTKDEAAVDDELGEEVE